MNAAPNLKEQIEAIRQKLEVIREEALKLNFTFKWELRVDFGCCVIEEWKTDEDQPNEYQFHEWAQNWRDAEHTVGYEQDVNDQYHDAFISPCGSEGCLKQCPALHAKRPRELWPIGFNLSVGAGLIAEPENVSTMEEWLDRSLKRGKFDDQN